ncbi:hypothetical protein [Streptomyces sp. NPDC001401]|uniref:hypothetical protein n=1 Tax=Streptomyces sp. NPDC001401 TaxID=3364570 RepID=UPI0036CA1BD7
MTAEGAREPRRRGSAGEAVRGGAQKLREDGRVPTTIVPVMPLWDRPRTGVCR